MRLSVTRLLTVPISKEVQKSISDVKAPLSLRAAMISSMAASPTLRTAASPKRIAPLSTLKFVELALISGGRILMPIRRASSIYAGTLVELSIILVSIAAIYSAG